ncbi:MAG TPA: hypothetical protein VH682_31105 [Gemmataceae bacterium]|jgi:hypothetical protein
MTTNYATSGGRTKGAGKLRRAFLAVWHCYLDAVLGAVLALAGFLKGQQLLINPFVGRAGGFPHWLLIGAAAFELSFGFWLLVGLYRHLTRWLALLWFTSLAAVALAQVMGGDAFCACFGELHTSPRLMFLFDVAAVTALWCRSPHNISSP